MYIVQVTFLMSLLHCFFVHMNAFCLIFGEKVAPRLFSAIFLAKNNCSLMLGVYFSLFLVALADLFQFFWVIVRVSPVCFNIGPYHKS
jgi:hypothetical protein